MSMRPSSAACRGATQSDTTSNLLACGTVYVQVYVSQQHTPGRWQRIMGMEHALVSVLQ